MKGTIIKKGMNFRNYRHVVEYNKQDLKRLSKQLNISVASVVRRIKRAQREEMENG